VHDENKRTPATERERGSHTHTQSGHISAIFFDGFLLFFFSVGKKMVEHDVKKSRGLSMAFVCRFHTSSRILVDLSFFFFVAP
jgi:hypothetical protein